ncbi:MAG: hypothetical protein GY940_33200, partial [bacterium]|nr:hypothetical protein [bacterium]
MKTLTDFLLMELRRFLRPKVLTILLIFSIVALGLLQYGISDHNDDLGNKENFRQLEQKKVTKYVAYPQYGTYGFRMLFLAHPMGIFFNNSAVPAEVHSFVDSGERLKIYYPLKGKNIFRLKSSDFTSFLGFLLGIGSLLCLVLGRESYQSAEWFKFLSSLSSPRHIYFLSFFSRLGILLASLALLCVSGLALTRLNGVPVSAGFFFTDVFPTVFGVLGFFLALGTYLGTFKSKATGWSLLITSWFALVFLVPAAVNFYIAQKSKNITPLSRHEMDKLTVVMDFEKGAIKEGVTYKYGEELKQKVKDKVLSYYNNEFKKIHSKEDELRAEMASNISSY